MANVNHAIQAKSDQLNYSDFAGSKKIVFITEVKVSAGDQPVSIFYDGHNGRPWKPNKGTIRILCEAYGEESDNWIGKSVELYGDSTVKWAGAEIGGIRISALSDIGNGGLTCFVTMSRGKRRKTTIPLLVIEVPKPSADDMEWINLIRQDPSAINQLNEGEYKERIKSFLN